MSSRSVGLSSCMRSGCADVTARSMAACAPRHAHVARHALRETRLCASYGIRNSPAGSSLSPIACSVAAGSVAHVCASSGARVL
eukprot:3111189-Prymnesium_polylepis.1